LGLNGAIIKKLEFALPAFLRYQPFASILSCF